MKESAPSLHKRNIFGMSKGESKKVISARWKCRSKIIIPLSAYAVLFDLGVYFMFFVLGIGQDYAFVAVIAGVIQTAAVIKLAFDLRDDVLNKDEREYYNSLG